MGGSDMSGDRPDSYICVRASKIELTVQNTTKTFYFLSVWKYIFNMHIILPRLRPNVDQP
jgi:hypothetical protein